MTEPKGSKVKFSNLSKIAATLLVAGAAAQAIAGPVSINRGAYTIAGGDGITAPFDELGLTGTLATSVYTPASGQPIGVGTAILDTNITSILTGMGINTGTYTAIDGATQRTINTVATNGQRNIDSLNPLDNSADDVEGFNAPSFVSGYWNLRFDYVFTGYIGADGQPHYDGGYLNLYYYGDASDPNNGTQVLRMNVQTSNIAAGDLDLFGVFTFDFNGDGDIADELSNPFVAAFWNDVNTGQTYADLEGSGAQLTWKLDTNVNPPIPNDTQLVAFGDHYVRQTTLDSSIVFNVPEPGTLSLLGLSFVGLAALPRRRKQAK